MFGGFFFLFSNVWTVTKRQNMGFKKLVTKSNANYDIKLIVIL